MWIFKDSRVELWNLAHSLCRDVTDYQSCLFLHISPGGPFRARRIIAKLCLEPRESLVIPDRWRNTVGRVSCESCRAVALANRGERQTGDGVARRREYLSIFRSGFSAFCVSGAHATRRVTARISARFAFHARSRRAVLRVFASVADRVLLGGRAASHLQRTGGRRRTNEQTNKRTNERAQRDGTGRRTLRTWPSERVRECAYSSVVSYSSSSSKYDTCVQPFTRVTISPPSRGEDRTRYSDVSGG